MVIVNVDRKVGLKVIGNDGRKAGPMGSVGPKDAAKMIVGRKVDPSSVADLVALGQKVAVVKVIVGLSLAVVRVVPDLNSAAALEARGLVGVLVVPVPNSVGAPAVRGLSLVAQHFRLVVRGVVMVQVLLVRVVAAINRSKLASLV